MQLDIFEHSRDIMLRNDALQALLGRDAAAARTAAHRLADAFPDDVALADLAPSITMLEALPGAAFGGHGDADRAIGCLADKVEPAAARLLGNADGAAWCRPLWHRLAERAASLDFDAAHERSHAAPLWLRAAQPQAAADAAGRIASWRRMPAPLAWMCEARWQLDGLDACWGLMAELAWLAPARFDALLQRRADPRLQSLRRRFDQSFEGIGNIADLAWFPAWVLTDMPALAPLLGQAQPGMHSEPERGMRLLLDLLHLERQGRQRELVEQRRRLRDLHPALFAAYMARR
jgi:hypothetical protein